MDRRTQLMTSNGLMIVAAIWLIVAPFVLGFSDQSNVMWNSIIVGIIVGVLAAYHIWAEPGQSWPSWVNAVLGLWVIASPWVYGNADMAEVMWNGIIAGIIVAALGLWSALTTTPTQA